MAESDANKAKPLGYQFYSLYAILTGHKTENLAVAEHNAYARFIEEVQVDDNR